MFTRLVKNLFSEKIQNSQLAGRLAHFNKNLEKLIQDQEILSVVKEYVIQFLKVPVQRDLPEQVTMPKTQELLIDQKIMEMMGKGAIKKTGTSIPRSIPEQYSAGKKEGWGKSPLYKLKSSNKFIPCKHFKMEDLHCLKYLLKENDFLCKIDLKDAYFLVPLCMSSRKCVRFGWLGNLYEFLCLCFGLGPAPRIFPKLLKVPIALLRRLNICLVIYLDGIVLMGRTEEILMSRNTLIFLLQHLGFVINLKKSVLTPSQQIEFLGLTIDTYTMTVALTEEKMEKAI